MSNVESVVMEPVPYSERTRVVLEFLSAFGPSSCAALAVRCGAPKGGMIITLRKMRDAKLVAVSRYGRKALWALPESLTLAAAMYREGHLSAVERRKKQKLASNRRRKEERLEAELERWANTVTQRWVAAHEAPPLHHVLPEPSARLDFLLAGAT